MVETILAMLLLCLFFFALFQYAENYTAKTVLYHAANAAARARTVGFNKWMVRKTALAAAIPVSGRCLQGSGFSEVSLLPTYLEAPDKLASDAVLSYEHWPWTDVDIDEDARYLRAEVRQSRPLLLPLEELEEGLIAQTNGVRLVTRGFAEMEAHWPLYLENARW